MSGSWGHLSCLTIKKKKHTHPLGISRLRSSGRAPRSPRPARGATASSSVWTPRRARSAGCSTSGPQAPATATVLYVNRGLKEGTPRPSPVSNTMRSHIPILFVQVYGVAFGPQASAYLALAYKRILTVGPESVPIADDGFGYGGAVLLKLYGNAYTDVLRVTSATLKRPRAKAHPASGGDKAPKVGRRDRDKYVRAGPAAGFGSACLWSPESSYSDTEPPTTNDAGGASRAPSTQRTSRTSPPTSTPTACSFPFSTRKVSPSTRSPTRARTAGLATPTSPRASSAATLPLWAVWC